MDWLLNEIVVPVASSVLGLVATVVVPVMTTKAVRYMNRRWKLDIDAREAARLEDLASDVVHKVEAQLGPGRGQEKLTQAVREVTSHAASLGIDVGEDVVRGKIEKMLRWEIQGSPMVKGLKE